MRGERTGATLWPALQRFTLPGGHSRPLLKAFALCAVIALGVLTPLLNASSALACGLVDAPTMFANGQPATLLTKPGGTLDTPITGFFATQGTVGEQVSFREDLSNMSSAPPASTLQWRWDFGDGGKADGITATHTFTKPGKYTILSQVQSNGSWDNDFDSAYLTVIAAASSALPTVSATSSAVVTDPNTPIVFDASGSHAADGSPLTYYWNFADYTTSTDASSTHTFNAYLVSQSPSLASVVTLVVTDKHGAQTVKYFDIEVVKHLPIVALDVSAASASTGDNITFTARVTTPATPTPTGASGPPSTPGGTLAPSTPTTYVWTFGDGSKRTTTTPTITRPYEKTGDFHVTVQVLDQHGCAYPSTGSTTINVNHDYASLVLKILGALLVLVVGFFLIISQFRRNRLIRERAAAMALARARAVQAGRDRRTQARQRAIQTGNYPRTGPPPPRSPRRP